MNPRGRYTELDRLKRFDVLYPQRWRMNTSSIIHGVHHDSDGDTHMTACGIVILASLDRRIPDDTYTSCPACERGWWARMYRAGYKMSQISRVTGNPLPTIHLGLQLAGAMTPNESKAWYTP